jgi:hypothetical protein
MPKPPKVVPIQEQKYRLIARDQKSQRIILGIGSERIAIDFFSRISKLAPETGDQPAAAAHEEKQTQAEKDKDRAEYLNNPRAVPNALRIVY